MTAKTKQLGIMNAGAEALEEAFTLQLALSQVQVQ